ncbi:MAG: PIN domain-containing protein [Candidatus Methanoperedens sp.]|nr:PIN domain-containing protein [Candidatus Methanoperedens sp.]
MRIFLDTNVFLTILNEEKNWQFAKKLLLDVNNGNHTGYTSVICISEILSGFYAEGESEKGEMFITDLKAISNIIIADVDLIIAKDAAKMRAKYKIKLPDAIIASSCKIHKCKLITQDEDFRKIREIEVKSIDEI